MTQLGSQMQSDISTLDTELLPNAVATTTWLRCDRARDNNTSQQRRLYLSNVLLNYLIGCDVYIIGQAQGLTRLLQEEPNQI